MSESSGDARPAGDEQLLLPRSYTFVIHACGSMSEEARGSGGALSLVVKAPNKPWPVHVRFGVPVVVHTAQYYLSPERVDDLVTCLASALGYAVPRRTGYRRGSSAGEDRFAICDGYFPVVSVSRRGFGPVAIQLEESDQSRRALTFRLRSNVAATLLEKLAHYFSWDLTG